MIGQIIRTEGKRLRECHTSDSSGKKRVVTWGIHPLDLDVSLYKMYPLSKALLVANAHK